jgi:polyisoprenoid-binding protein YceI
MAGCAGSGTQHATVTAPVLPYVSTPASATADERWLIAPPASKIELHAQAAMVPEDFTFKRFRAYVVTNESRETARFHADVETASLEGGGPGVAPFVRTNLLETSVFPKATFDGTVRRSPGTDACVVNGVLTLRDVTQDVRFEATLHDEPDAIHFEAEFDLPRKPFGIRLVDPWDAFVADDVRVVLNVSARRERVKVEVVSP